MGGMKKILILACAIALQAGAVEWRGLDDAKWYSGPKISSKDLAGKVVMVDEWGVHCPPCRALLPKMEALWKKFKSKPFVLIGSHRQGRQAEEVKALVDANKLTYPIYDFAGMAEGEPSSGGGLPFMYVVDARGNVVYSGRSEPDAVAAVEKAVKALGLPPSITPGWRFEKNSAFRQMENQLVLGKPAAPCVRKLKAAIKQAEKNSAGEKQKAAAEEAKQILSALATGRTEVMAEIEAKKSTDPKAAAALEKLYKKTFPASLEL